MSRILVIGDSYAEGIESDTSQALGWPDIMGIPANLRQGIGGSTAIDWAQDKDGRLTKAIQTPSDVLIVSLLGNDIMSETTPVQVIVSIESLHSVISKCMSNKRTFVFLYADPFLGKNDQSRFMTPLLNRSIRIACFGLVIEYIDLSVILTDSNCFNGSDIHPTRYGHQLIANYLRNVKIISALEEVYNYKR